MDDKIFSHPFIFIFVVHLQATHLLVLVQNFFSTLEILFVNVRNCRIARIKENITLGNENRFQYCYQMFLNSFSGQLQPIQAVEYQMLLDRLFTNARRGGGKGEFLWILPIYILPWGERMLLWTDNIVCTTRSYTCTSHPTADALQSGSLTLRTPPISVSSERASTLTIETHCWQRKPLHIWTCQPQAVTQDLA